MGILLLAGGFVGSGFGVFLFKLMRSLGQVDLIITLFDVTFLGLIGAFMLIESVQAIRRARQPLAESIRRRRHNWVHGPP